MTFSEPTARGFTDWVAKGRAWGKVDIAFGTMAAWLPLEHHCLDVAITFRALAGLPAFYSRLVHCGLPSGEAALERLAVLAFLHDIGKANPGFQAKVFSDAPVPGRGHTRGELANLLQFHADDAFRVLCLDRILGWFSDEKTAERFLLASWSHHGTPLTFEELDARFELDFWAPVVGLDPWPTLAVMQQSCARAFPNAWGSKSDTIPANAALQHQFAGLTMLADWLGSHRDYFPLNGDVDTLTSRQDRARDGAKRLLRDIGLDTSAHRRIHGGWASFAASFGTRPRPLQAAVEQLPLATLAESTWVAESDTGSGKTEAALAMFERLYEAGLVDGLYFALPTRVAARELYRRVVRFIATRFPGEHPQVLLAIPGYAQLAVAPVALPDSGRWEDSSAVRMRDLRWSMERPKRFLAAPVVVGTIDQALLSCVRAPHAHLRSICLDRHLLVVDEVHSSDAYMRSLLVQLLRHREKLSAKSLLLSATLTHQSRCELLGVSGAALLPLMLAVDQPYPSLVSASSRAVVPTVLSGAADEGTAGSLSASPVKQVQLTCRPWLFQPERVAHRVSEAVRSGARVLVVLNTVNRSVAVQRAVEKALGDHHPALFRSHGIVCPHHGRFAAVDRVHLDDAVTGAFGLDRPPGGRVVIGTQTLEQSLDIDADLMLTDLCPMDVLLQRIGRLHRHTRNDRPPGFDHPVCELLVPDVAELSALLRDSGDPDPRLLRAGVGSVYPDLRIQELTWRYFRDADGRLVIPRDNRRAIEKAMHPEQMTCFADPLWSKVVGKTLGVHLQMQGMGTHAGLGSYYREPFGDVAFSTEDAAALGTRLGVGTREVAFGQPVAGPFGVDVSGIAVRGDWIDSQYDGAPVVAQRKAGEIEFSVRGADFHYGRFGLRRVPSREGI